MAEDQGEKVQPVLRELIKQGKEPLKTLAETVGMSPLSVKELGKKIEKQDESEKKETKPEKKPKEKSSIAKLWEAFLDAVVMTEGISLESGQLKRSAQPLREWSREDLQKTYKSWLAYKPDKKIPEAEHFRKAMMDAISKVAAKRNIWAYVVLEKNWEATSVLDMTPLAAGKVKEANKKVGEAFERFAGDWEAAEHNIDMLLDIYAEWRALQKSQKLKTTFDAKNTEELSVADQAAQAVIEKVKDALAKRQIDNPDTQQPSASVVRPSQMPPAPEQAIDMTAQRAAVLEEIHRLQEEAKQAARLAELKGEKVQYAPPPSKNPEQLAGDLLQTAAFQDDPKAAAAAAMRMSSRHVPDGPILAGAGRARAESVGRHSGGEDYLAVKARLMRQDDWSGYGWAPQEKSQLIQILGLGEEASKEVLAAVLLQGKTAAECLAVLKSAKDAYDLGKGRSDYLFEYLKDLDILSNDDAVMKILIPSDLERRAYLDQRFFQLEPRNIEELAWQIEFETPGIFGKQGAYPVLQRIVAEGKPDANGIKRFEFKERVKAANIVQWLRYAQFQAHSNHTMKPMDFAQEVGLVKQFKTVNVYEMLLHKAAMGHSKYGGDEYKDLIEYLEVETGLYGAPRANYLNVWHNKGAAGDMLKIRTEQFYENSFTRPFGGKSMFTWMHQMSETFDLEAEASDGKMGAAINTAFWTYANIANPQEMARVLGYGDNVENLAELFNLRNLRKARNQFTENKKENPDTWLDLSYKGSINGVKIKDIFEFDSNGNLIGDGKAKLRTPREVYNFMAMWNFYAYTDPSENGKTLFRAVVRDRAAELHGIATSINGIAVPWNKEMAENIAFYNTWFFGVSATNDVLGAAHQWETKTSGDYRRKTIGGKLVKGEREEGRAGEYGNPYTVEIFKRWLISPFHGIRTTTPDKDLPGNFKAISQVMGEAERTRFEIDQRLHLEVETKFQSGALNAKIEEKMKQIEEVQNRKLKSHDLNHEDVKTDDAIRTIAEQEVKMDEWNRLLQTETGKNDLKTYKAKSEEFVFKEDSMYKYMKDHYEKGVHLDERLRGAKNLKFDKYIRYVPLVGAAFDQEEWQKDMAGLVTDVRYAFQNYGSLNYDMKIWDWDPKIEAVREMTLGESMFGDQLVNIPKFKGKDGKVDWTKVQNNQKTLYKRWLESFIIGQLLQYRELTTWNTNPRYSFTMTEDILEAIAKIPSIVEYDDKNMRRTQVTEFFFSKEAMRRIRKESGTTKYKMYFLEILNSGLFGGPGRKEGLLSGLMDALGIIFEKSLSGTAAG